MPPFTPRPKRVARSPGRVRRRIRVLSLCLGGTLALVGVACTSRPSSPRKTVVSAGAASVRGSNGVPRAPVAANDTEIALARNTADAGVPALGMRRTCPELPAVSESGTPCGELHCLAFESPAAAFEHVLALEPRVLGIGESHAQKGSESVVPTTRRFADLLLPRLCGRTHSMILEVWLPRGDCGDERVQQVAKKQKPVTANQSKSNKDEYVALGYAAKRLGIEPSALVPTCDEYQSILDAGPDSIERMLVLIGHKTAERALEELHRVPESELGPALIAYGGALHNDAEPTPEHLEFSYGPRMLRATNGRYIELDLVIREYVKDTEIWQKQPYYHALRENPVPGKTLLYQWADHSFGLVFSAR